MNKSLEALLALAVTAGIVGCDTRNMKVTIEKPAVTKVNSSVSRDGSRTHITFYSQGTPSATFTTQGRNPASAEDDTYNLWTKYNNARKVAGDALNDDERFAKLNSADLNGNNVIEYGEMRSILEGATAVPADPTPVCRPPSPVAPATPLLPPASTTLPADPITNSKPSYAKTPAERYEEQLRLRKELDARVYGGSGTGGSSTPAGSSATSVKELGGNDVYERAFELLKSGKEGYALRQERDITGRLVQGRVVFVAQHPKEKYGTTGTPDIYPTKEEDKDEPGYIIAEFWSGYIGKARKKVERDAWEMFQENNLEYELRNKRTRSAGDMWDILGKAAGCDDTVTVEELKAVLR